MVRSGNIYKYTGLFIALVLPVSLALLRFKFSDNLITDALIKECCMWGLFLGLIIVAKYGEREPIRFSTNNMGLLNTIGLSMLIVISFFVFGILYGLFYHVILKTQPPHEAMMDKLMKYPLWLKLIIAIRAGIVEETFFRAYGMSRIKQLTNSNVLAFIIPLLFFAGGHYSYGTINHVVGTFFIGAILAVYYLRSKNLIANIIGHTLFDIVGLVVKSV